MVGMGVGGRRTANGRRAKVNPLSDPIGNLILTLVVERVEAAQASLERYASAHAGGYPLGRHYGDFTQIWVKLRPDDYNSRTVRGTGAIYRVSASVRHEGQLSGCVCKLERATVLRGGEGEALSRGLVGVGLHFRRRNDVTSSCLLPCQTRPRHTSH
jgi:hypothetical protein